MNVNPHHHGFTYIEMILVIIIVAVIGISVNPFRRQVSLSLQAESRRILSDIRYAQALSMASGIRYRWVRTSSTTYQIINASGSAITLPNGSSTMTLSAGNSITGITNLPSNLIAFNTQGIPYVDTGSPGTPLAATATITLSNSGLTSTVSVLAGTGFGAIS